LTGISQLNFRRRFETDTTKTTLALALTAAFGVTGAAHAGSAFAMQSLDSGYMVAAADDKAKDGKCGEGKCGSSKNESAKAKDGKCGEGKCGADKAAASADTENKAKDGKCGEGKCGAKK